jgi:hypothetical protein
MPELFSLHESMILMHIIKFLQRHRRFQGNFIPVLCEYSTGCMFITARTIKCKLQFPVQCRRSLNLELQEFSLRRDHHCGNYQMQTSISSPVQKKFEAGITRILSKTLTFKWLANEVHSTYRTPRRQMLPPHLQLPKQLQQSRIQNRRDKAKFSTALN